MSKQLRVAAKVRLTDAIKGIKFSDKIREDQEFVFLSIGQEFFLEPLKARTIKDVIKELAAKLAAEKGPVQKVLCAVSLGKRDGSEFTTDKRFAVSISLKEKEA